MTDQASYDAMAGRAFMELLGRTHLSTAAALPTIVAEAAAAFGGSAVTLYLVDHEQETLVLLRRGSPEDPERLPLEGTLHGWSFTGSTIVATDGGTADHRQLILPLIDGTERLGTIAVTLPATGGEVPTELVAVAERFAHLTAQSIVTKALYGDDFEQVRRSRPMEVSAELIRGLLPPPVFATDDLVISAVLEPCYSVGGDSFDYAVNGRTAHVAIFDAMGHGLAAAGDASFAVAAYRNTRHRRLGLVDMCNEMDVAIRHQPGDRYVTAVLSELDLDTGVLRWLSAGHPPPMLLRDSKFIKLLEAEPHTPLGVSFGAVDPVVAEEALEPGDMVLFYTDGLPEARLPDGEFFTVERLAEFIERQAAAGLPAPETLRRLRGAVLTHQQGSLQDDATAVLIQWRAGAEKALLPGPTHAGGLRR